jgi:hypothetical protein
MRSRWIAAAVFVHAASSFVPAAPERFAPEDHFPKECFFFASLDLGKLRRGLQETPFGRMLTHPGVEKALGGLKDMALAGMMEGSQEFTQLMGVTPLEFVALFEGEVAWTVPGVDMRHGPTTLISIELGSKRKEIEGAMERFGNAMLGRAGDAQTTEVKGHKVTTWPEQFGPSLQYTILGNSLVFGVGGALEAVIGRFEGEGGGSDALRFNPVYARAKLQASVASPVGTCFLNWEAIRGIVNTMTLSIFSRLLDTPSTSSAANSRTAGEAPSSCACWSRATFTGCPTVSCSNSDCRAITRALRRFPIMV